MTCHPKNLCGQCMRLMDCGSSPAINETTRQRNPQCLSAWEPAYRRPCQLLPLGRLHARDRREAALAVRLEDRGLALAHVKPVLPESIEDIWLVRDDHNVGAGGRHGCSHFAHRLRAPAVLIRGNDETAFRVVRRRLTLAEAKQLAGFHRAIELAGSNLADR